MSQKGGTFINLFGTIYLLVVDTWYAHHYTKIQFKSAQVDRVPIPIIQNTTNTI